MWGQMTQPIRSLSPPKNHFNFLFNISKYCGKSVFISGARIHSLHTWLQSASRTPPHKSLLSDHTHFSVSTISPKVPTPIPMDIPVRITNKYISYSKAKNKNVTVPRPVMTNSTLIPLKHFAQQHKPQKLQMAFSNVGSLSNKMFLLNDLIVEHHLDCRLSETWLNSDAPAVLFEMSPSNYNFFYSCREGKRGGGLASYHCF